MRYAPPSIQRLGIVIPCLATCAANVANVTLTRLPEITIGTTVRDNDDRPIGVSRIAGMECVRQTALTRCVLVPMTCLLLPPAIMSMCTALRILPRSGRGRMLLELVTIYASLQAALPAALAVYPQRAEFELSELEIELRSMDRRDRSGRLVTKVYANKGM